MCSSSIVQLISLRRGQHHADNADDQRAFHHGLLVLLDGDMAHCTMARRCPSRICTPWRVVCSSARVTMMGLLRGSTTEQTRSQRYLLVSICHRIASASRIDLKSTTRPHREIPIWFSGAFLLFVPMKGRIVRAGDPARTCLLCLIRIHISCSRLPFPAIHGTIFSP